jgi:hypothetical protein
MMLQFGSIMQRQMYLCTCARVERKSDLQSCTNGSSRLRKSLATRLKLQALDVPREELRTEGLRRATSNVPAQQLHGNSNNAVNAALARCGSDERGLQNVNSMLKKTRCRGGCWGRHDLDLLHAVCALPRRIAARLSRVSVRRDRVTHSATALFMFATPEKSHTVEVRCRVLGAVVLGRLSYRSSVAPACLL